MNKRYPEYKASGIEWLGEVPEHWTLRKLKYAVTLTKEGAGERHEDFQIALENIESWTGQFIETDSEYSGSGDAFEEGDILFNKLRPYLAKVFHAQRAGTPVGELLVLRPESDVSSRFLFYRLLSPEFIDVVDGSTYGAKMPRASWDFIGDLKIPIPPLEEQRTIATYLDRKTEQIDTLIAKKQRLIDLLQEQRTAVINRAVTQGLDPDAAMQDSGIEWLGEVPAHWAVTKLKFLSPQVTVGIVVKPSQYYVEEGVPCLRSLNVKERQLITDDLIHISPEDNEELRKSMLFEGDLVAVRTGQPGTTAVVDERFDGANCIDLLIIRNSEKFNSDFMAYVMNSGIAKAQYGEGSEGAIQQHFNVGTAKDLRVAVPPREEQDGIVKKLDERVESINMIIEREETLIDMLKELRTSLISEVVTGKIDVRDEVPVQAEVAA